LHDSTTYAGFLEPDEIIMVPQLEKISFIKRMCVSVSLFESCS